MPEILSPEARASALAYFADPKRDIELDHTMSLNKQGTFETCLVLRMRFPSAKSRDEIQEAILKFQEVK